MKSLGKSGFGLGIVCATLGLSAQAAKAECINTSANSTYDRYYIGDPVSGWDCQEMLIDYWWDAFNMKNWDGFGYDNPCYIQTPLGRTFNALWVLGYSSTNSPHCNRDVSNVTEWAMCWAGKNISSLKPSCDDKHNAYTSIKSVKLYYPFFYEKNPVQRAAIIVHEARHAGGCVHNYTKQCSSCDKSWENGCTWTGKDEGTNRYAITFLSWFANTAFRATTALREGAVSQANSYLGGRFRDDPCFRLDSRGLPYQSC